MKNPLKKKEVPYEIDIFREQVEKGLENLRKEEIVLFAWRCAVRELPFLGAKGNFNFWKEEEQQKNLHANLYAMDVVAAYTAYTYTASAYNDFADTVIYTVAARAAFPSYAYPAVALAALAAAAAFPADAARAAARAAYAVATARFYGTDQLIFQQSILKDLQPALHSGGGDWAEGYGPVWGNFKQALENNGCGYWAKWYQSLFEKGLVLDEEDEEEIKMRLNVPAEIKEQGAAAVGRYMEQLGKGSERLNEARILILGDKGAGKTCLARRLNNPNADMTTDEESTPGVDTTLWKLEKENVNVHIWDFAGHTVTHAVHQFFLSERCLYIIVYDGRTEERNRLGYWLDHMKNYGKDSKAIILVNKRDAHAVEVPVNRLKEQYPILDVCTFSIRDDKDALENFRQEVADYINNNPSWSNLLIPENSYKVKNELEKIFNNGDKNNGKELINRDEFDKITEKYGVKDSESLLSDLHALGISLWYKDMAEFNTLVLNPEWISNGVYQIINWVNNQKRYSLTINDLKLVFEKDATRYPEDHHHYLCELMKKYELAYKSVKKDELIIPRLLHEDQPADMPQFPVNESLMARYKADQPLMPDTISRFIVRHNQEIKKAGDDYQVWRSGVILEAMLGTIAIVREENDRTITVSVKGTNKTEFLSAIRETLNTIFETYKSKKPEFQYRIQRFGEISEEVERQDPLWLTDRKILAHAQSNIPYFDDSTGKQITLKQIVNNYNITTQTLISGQNIHWDQSVHNTFNFKDCNISLQGSLNDLAQLMKEAGSNEEAREFENIAKALQKSEQCQSKEDIKKKGILNRLKRFVMDLNDKNSQLHHKVREVNSGESITQAIAMRINEISQWVDLSQVPIPFKDE